ncbi:MAG: hypothetical protein IK136_03630 [Oscillospiraceae bacterium]|nr:hypothetical protein [Oscillospiraceae bacterium]
MGNEAISRLTAMKKNFVFIGEAGSGKSEVAINFAMEMVGEAAREVHFFDMDQTKPMLRSRDAADRLKEAGIIFHSAAQLLDAPIVPSAVIESLTNEDRYVIMDVGGGELGAHMIGQFANWINAEDTYVLFIINPYRPWSRDAEHAVETMNIVTGCSRIEKVHLVSNPNLGPGTTAEDILAGSEKLRSMVGTDADFICVLEELVPQVEGKVREGILPMHIFIPFPWQNEI